MQILLGQVPAMSEADNAHLDQWSQGRVGLASYIRALVNCRASNSEPEHPHTVLLRHVLNSWSKGVDLLMTRRYQDVVDLWQPVCNNPFLDCTHAEWQGKSAFRAMIRSAIMQLFVARANRAGGGSLGEHIRLAYRYAEMLSRERFLLETVPLDLTLDIEPALIQDQNFADILELAVRWSREWLPSFDVEPADAAQLTQKLIKQKVELAGLIEKHTRA
jgi:hypothetical protein